MPLLKKKKKQEEAFEIIRKKNGRLYFKVKGKTLKILDSLMDVNITIFSDCVFNQDNIPIKDKFELLDAFMRDMKRNIEQKIVYNNS